MESGGLIVLRLPEDEAPHPGQTHEEVRDQSCGARFHEAGSSCHTHTHRLELPQSLTAQKHTHRELYTWTTSPGSLKDVQLESEVDADRGIQTETCSGQDDGQGDVPQRGGPSVVDVHPSGHDWDVS